MFLDEVENLPVEIQQMLLRAMEERRYRPMGGRQDKRMDVRVIAATNEDLQGAVAENASGRTCYTGCRILQSPCPRCRIAWKTYSHWLIFPYPICRTAGKGDSGF